LNLKNYHIHKKKKKGFRGLIGKRGSKLSKIKMKRTRKQYRKTRSKRRARRSRNAPLANSPRYFKHKITGVINIGGPALNGEQPYTQTVVFSRFDYAGIVSDVIGINTAPRWAQVKKNYE